MKKDEIQIPDFLEENQIGMDDAGFAPEKPDEKKRRKMTRQERAGQRAILLSAAFFLLLFAALILRFAFFIYFEGSGVVNNSYNRRQKLLAETVVRGEIRARDGEVLARTQVLEDGTELREYPYGRMFCHVVGQTGEHGATGIELSQSISLLTSDANMISRLSTQMKGEKLSGNNVVTTLDVGLTEAAYDALGSQKGAVVVLEPATGKILAMVSKSDYDPNTLAENWDALSADTENHPLLNRAISGLYPPGSSFKIVTALAFMEQRPYRKFSYDCDGKGIFSSVSIQCYNGTAHGQEDFSSAFAHSCNTAFAQMGTELDLAQFKKTAERLMFNQPLPSALSAKESSFVLSGKSEKSAVPQTAIGQGDTQITPLHNAMLAAAVANQGMVMEPYVVDHVETANGYVVSRQKPKQYRQVMTKKEAKVLRGMMRQVVTEGTATQLLSSQYEAAGKTGSAEFNASKDTHAWFVGYAKRAGGKGKPEIALAVLVENSGSGSVYAVPAARKIFDHFFENTQ